VHAAWALPDGPPVLGGFLALAHRLEVDHLHVCTDGEPSAASAKARQSTAFNLPVTLWVVRDGQLGEVPPTPLEAEPTLDGEFAEMRELFRAAGAETLVEDGALRAEVLGLEVARAKGGPDGPVLEVGVGRHDREARALMDADLHPGQSLPEVVETVRRLRRADVPAHPANRFAPERWLRALVVEAPERVGCTALSPIPAPISRPDLRQPAPAPAAGTDTEGRGVVAVCSVGVDPELVPLAADARTAASLAGFGEVGALRLLLVVPGPDAYPVTSQLAALLRHPAEVVTVDADWRSWTRK
jgi:hypothetical protein